MTAPLTAISTSMQLSVIPHLTVYGDVKESEVNKGGIIREKLEGIGLLDNKSRKEAEAKELQTEVRHDLTKFEARADLMKASG